MKRAMGIGVGIITAVCLVFIIENVIWLSHASSAANRIRGEMKNKYPDLSWAFEEITQCDEKQAQYGKYGFYTRLQCFKGVSARVADHRRPIVHQFNDNMITAITTTKVMWPLSILR